MRWHRGKRAARELTAGELMVTEAFNELQAAISVLAMTDPERADMMLMVVTASITEATGIIEAAWHMQENGESLGAIREFVAREFQLLGEEWCQN